jgi:hypothetical protein
LFARDSRFRFCSESTPDRTKILNRDQKKSLAV